jgi:nucleotide-binding universal stress UspA family protein
MFTNIVCATDGSEHADRALLHAAEIAQRDGAALHVVHIVERLPGRKMAGQLNTYLNEDELDEKFGRQTREITADRNVRATFHTAPGRSGHVAQRIVDVMNETGGDLIVVGTRGHSGLVGALLGSVTQDLLHIAPCPVLAVPPIRPAAHTPSQTGSLTTAG